jgi:pimeloyl-ACP methyl ester carboxylesterase
MKTPVVELRAVRRISRALLVASVLLAGPGTRRAVAAEPPAPPRLALAPCKLPGLEKEAQCGTFEVFEDRAARSGRKIPLRVAVLPATGPDRAPDPLFFFNGGPGDSAVKAASGMAHQWAEVRKKRDIVLVDVRGTGESNGLACKALQGHQGVLGYMESFLPVPGVRACRLELEPRADLRLYTTTPAVDDVDDVRAALGYDRINLNGGSYGTLAALVYMRRHPEHVRTAVLEGLVLPDSRLPLYFAHDAQVALDQVLAACAKDAACHAAFPDPAGDVSRVLATLEKVPAKATVRDAKTGKPVEIVLSRSAVAQTIRYMLYIPVTAAQIPLQIHLAARGDYVPLAETAYLFGNFVTSTSDGFYLSVTCAEDVALFDAKEAAEAAKGTFLGDFRARVQKAACAEWPRGSVPPGFEKPVSAKAPTLLVSGERDPVTPAYWAERAARTLPRSLRIVIPGGGHGVEGLKGIEECVDRIAARLVESGTEKGIDTSCVAKIQPVPFLLRDERVAEVQLGAAELDRFAGAYVSGDGGEIVVRREGDVLRMQMGEGDAPALAPVGKTRFRILGAPSGFFVEFELEGESVSGMVMEEGPGGKERLRRKK